jgi:triphosphoribosyl-dephospho-CoA synthetase
MNCSPARPLEHLAAALARGAALELYLTPKPGLVDRADRGAHPDLSLSIMEQSIGIVADYLADLVVSLSAGEAFARQRAIAIAAEQRMFGELGTNTHKGYIFLAGMLLIARHHADSSDEATVRRTLAALASEFFASSPPLASHGGYVRLRYGAGGIVHEACRGLPALFDTALPAFRACRAQGGSFTTASFAMLARLMQTVDDSTTLHRGGRTGLARVRRDGRRLERLLAAGDDYPAFLRACNRDYVRLNLTMGGIADLLALAYGWLLAGSEIGEDSWRRQTTAHLSTAAGDSRWATAAGALTGPASGA